MNVTEIYGSKVFNDTVMREKLPKDVYKALKKSMQNGSHLELDVANTVAGSMKDWAVSKGATHFTHWFQPMTGITAEKHDSFISPIEGGKVIMEFSGKELVKGEPDASSFPSGGLRATFEARGYTVWDVSSYAFIKDDTLCIPTAFCSYSGEVLDKKTPLLRSMQVLNKHSLRILKLFGKADVKRVISTIGVEQEYFLIDRNMYKKRSDLIMTGRTLFGARPPKGQELDDHYFGNLKPRVSEFMKDLERELWSLGIPVKTKHNEVAPAQHELAPIFETTNIAADHNQITMEIAKRVAIKHSLACILHEKPFAGINGSGKHNNWSMSTDLGQNLLDPGDTPHENAQFLLFLVAVIKAVDMYGDLLRVSIASGGNDHRLGASEAPPAIVSIFLGDELSGILESIENEKTYQSADKQPMEIGASVLPHFSKDTTDRNRTSPFAFTGNKFEFRMPGSSLSISGPNIVLNTAVAEVLSGFADELEKADDFDKALAALIKETIHNHKRIIFNGNNYSEEWAKEAEKRGLYNMKNTVETLPYFILPKNIELFEKHGVLSKAEIMSRYEILLEGYSKSINIEALCFIDIAKKQILPACLSYQMELISLIKGKEGLGEIEDHAEKYLLQKISALSSLLLKNIALLENVLVISKDKENPLDIARAYKENVVTSMQNLRKIVDELETLVSKDKWNIPTYADILYSVD